MATPDSKLIVVGIGASAGGLEALKEFFAAMPAASGLAFVVIQHLDPTHVSYMADLLAKGTAMSVVPAEHGTAVAADTVYTIPPNKFLMIRGGRLCLSEPEKRDGIRMPIDFFFRSLAEDQRDNAVCVLLSGSGSDGTQGLREVRAGGGMTLVQHPETAQFDAMIKSAIATGMVDRVLPLREIPEAILGYQRRAYADIKTDEQARLDTFDAILDLLATRSENDFTAYKKTTLLRRADRRMGINRLASLSDYLRFLQTRPDEIDQLAKDMLIGVSSFFRDPEAFEELRRSVIAPLVRERADGSSLRVWVPGCATGEEAYSIAISLSEELEAANKRCPLQIFASDIDGDALKFARDGIYPQSIAADVSEPRLNHFFIKQDTGYQVGKPLRDSVIFSAQNLLTEAPFSKLDLISCRNLLIYIEPAVQRRLLSVFAFALNRDGYLFLGNADGMVAQSPLFSAVSAKWRIYRRDSRAPSGIAEFSFSLGGKTWGIDPLRKREAIPYANLSEFNQEAILKHFDASVVLIDEQGNILYFYGSTGKYIDHPTGEASLNLLKMIENSLTAKFRLALREAVKDNRPVTLDRLRFNRAGSSLVVDVTIRPVTARSKDIRLFAVIFVEARERAPALPESVAPADGGDDEPVVAQLESELKTLKAEFQATIDDHETSTEELKAANEEILSINEELQSTNEELETSKEEIQAVNEELNTVNNQLNQKVEELTEVNSDLVNFLNASEVATIFLDNELRIKRFTPSAQNLMSLIPSDLGRPVGHMTHKLTGLDLVADALGVLRGLAPVTKEVQAADGRWYAMRCLPYRTLDNKINGAILTLNDVTQLKQSEVSMEEARNFAESIVETVREALLVLDRDLRVVSANWAFYRTFQLTPQESRNRSIFELGDRQWDIPQFRKLLEETVSENREFNDYEVEHDFPALGHRSMLLNARRIQHANRPTELILLSIDDITDRKRLQGLLASEEQLRQHAGELEQQLIASGRLVSLGEITASMAHEFNNPLGIVMGFAEDLLSEIDPASPHYQPLKIIDEETKRCQKIIQELMAFARPRPVSRHAIDIAAVIDTTLRMIDNRLFKQKVTLTKDLRADLPRIQCDEQQIEQLLINLYLNALDAMLNGGSLTVRAGLERGDDSQSMAAITVADSGAGIDEQDLPKIFQPFFTAKKKTGLGLGLSICQRIVNNHGGRIDVQSRRNGGTTFKISLPVERQSE